jgi:4-amino-4-deoxy-L-arabinose transferase-like glycosyltransferase
VHEEELPALTPSLPEMGIGLAYVLIVVAVAVASYRRSRLLSHYPVWRSVLIAVAAGAFWELWVIASIINRERLRREWNAYRRERAVERVPPVPV